ncbi:hypothetical protein MBANPS3_011771 [Mucor bainieri]
MSSLYSSKFPLPPANYENNSNVICRPWQLPGLFEKSLRLQDHISDRACRHVAFEPKNKLACNNTMHLKHELDRIPGDVKALRCNVGMDNATVVSFYSILDAKHCYAILKHKLSPCYQVSYVKPAFVYKSCQANSAEKLFLIFSSISARVDLLDYDYMKHIARFGSIYSISEARISRQCIIVNVEYHDERHGDALKANLNCAFIEGAQIMVYSATYNDEIGCTFASSSAISGKGRPIASSLSIDTTKKHMSRAAPYQPPHPPLATLTQSSMVATPLPSPVAEGESYFTVDPYLASKYHPVVSSLPPSPVALQHDQEAAAHPKPYASAPAPIDTSPSASASSNTTFGTCLSTQEEGASYAAAVVQSPSSPVSPTPSPPQITTTTNTTATTTPESSSCSNPTPSPSPTTRPGKKVAQNHPKSSSEEKLPATASSTRNSSSRRKRQAPSSPSNTKKAACNSVDFAKIQSGQDKRTTFMIRNIPNKYTQVAYYVGWGKGETERKSAHTTVL